MSASDGGVLVQFDRLVKEFTLPGRRTLRAVDDVSLQLRQGHTLAVVGESGSGKTTLTRLLLGLNSPTSGRVLFDDIDLARADAGQWRSIRSRMQVVLQDPFSSMNPRLRVGDIVAEPLLTHRRELRRDHAARRALVADMLDRVGLDPATADRFPHEFSGGQRQRISIARALVLNPEVVVLDEPTSALDVSVQAQVLDLLAELKEEFGLTFLFVSHNLAVVAAIADEVAVMRAGAVVEVGPAKEVFAAPRHEYTQALIAAVPEPDPTRSRFRQAVAR